MSLICTIVMSIMDLLYADFHRGAHHETTLFKSSDPQSSYQFEFRFDAMLNTPYAHAHALGADLSSTVWLKDMLCCWKFENSFLFLHPTMEMECFFFSIALSSLLLRNEIHESQIFFSLLLLVFNNNKDERTVITEPIATSQQQQIIGEREFLSFRFFFPNIDSITLFTGNREEKIIREKQIRLGNFDATILQFAADLRCSSTSSFWHDLWFIFGPFHM